jgi:phospho-N-acetylmuramoyl-pentapeptide-transferase
MQARVNILFGAVLILGFGISFVLIRELIKRFLGKGYFQPIHGDVSLHKTKKGTPTMGGIGIDASVIFASVFGLWIGFSQFGGIYAKAILTILLAMGLLGALGLYDDVSKIKKKDNLGLRARQKIVAQILTAAIFLILYYQVSGMNTLVVIPFSERTIDLGFFYPLYIIFVFIAIVNSVNLTDGMDGLSSSVTVIVSIFFVLFFVFFRRSGGAGFAGCVVLIATTGALLAFLIFNRNPAKIFMGDTGSLALGGALTAAAVFMKMELYLPIVGIVYVLEAASDIIQVGYFKASGGKRIFKMAPLHHHLELSGMKEKNVVLLLACLSLAAAIITMSIIFLIRGRS